MPNEAIATANSFPIPSPGKFALIALTEAAVSLKTPLEVNSSCWAFASLPFDLDTTWQKWLGELRCRELRDANLIILIAEPSTRPFVLSHEDEELQERVRTFLGALLVVKAPSLSRLNLIGGAISAEGYTVRSAGHLPWYFCRDGSNDTVREKDLVIAGKIFEGIEMIYAESNEFRLLGKGYEAFKRGMYDDRNDLRLHQFTRSLEALILPKVGQTTKNFRYRCQTFCKPGNAAAPILSEFYELRSRIEHHRDPYDLFPSKSKDEAYEILNHRAHQAEGLARFTYHRLLSNRSLLSFFRSEESIKQFWDLSEDQRRSFFPPGFSLI